MSEERTLAELHPTNRERAQHDRYLAFTTYSDLIYPILIRPCTVRILMVTDSGGSFGMADFGLGELLNVLSVSPGPWVRFAVTKANRISDATADISNFRFDAQDLSRFDEIWLFGVGRGNQLALSDAELRVLAQFMDGGGGVFATGDHEDLGLPMSGRIPRVRSMRKWYWPNAGPNGEPPAPPVDGPDRLDTLRPGNDPGYQFDDQSDDIPQTISARLYSGGTFSWIKRFYPHPLLCGPAGPINVLPDHPHEGECYVPADLTATFTFDGYTTEEYPALPNGRRLAPDVIAWSTVLGGRSAIDVKGPVNPRTFGAIGSYDGHRAGVGRVVVDATWHHFFNINLIGAMGTPDPIKSKGFYATPQGLAAYEEIKAYFRNIAVWLARPSRIACMRWRATWALRWHHQLLIELRPAHDGEGLVRLDLAELVRIGSAARDVLGRLATHCQALSLQLDLVELVRPDLRNIIPWIDPWRSLPEAEPDPTPWVHGVTLLDAALGGALYAVADQFPEASDEARVRAEEADGDEVVREGVGVALERALEAMDASREALDQLTTTLRRAQSAEGEQAG
jgi:hypothetical protein